MIHRRIRAHVALVTVGLVLGMVVTSIAAADQVKLQAPDGTDGTYFGAAVAVDGDTAVVGVQTLQAAYVFTRTAGVWDSGLKLTTPASAVGFGTAVAVSGDTVVVGANAESVDAPIAGAAYVFSRQAGVWNPAYQKRLTAAPPAPVDFFGHSVAVDGDTIVVGAWGTAGGSAYVFSRSDGWEASKKLTPGDPVVGKGFGLGVAIDGDTIVVGAPYDADAGALSGAAYVFVRSGDEWSQQGSKLTAAPSTPGAYFGYSVAVSGDTALVGSVDNALPPTGSSSAYVFTRSGGVWNPTPTPLDAPDAIPFGAFGRAVALDGDTAVVAAVLDDDRGADSGSAYVFQRSGGSWSLTEKLTADDGAANDQLGYSLAIAGYTVIAGAPRDDSSQGTDAGAAYVFTLEAPPAPATADAAVLVYTSQARPGFAMEYSVLAANLGEATATDVVVGLILPAEVVSPSCSPACDIQFVGGRFRVQWTRGDYLAGAEETLTVLLDLPIEVPLGTPLDATASITTTATDSRPGNNTYNHVGVTVGSYDPNDKGVSPQGFLRGDEELFYVIHFENEGTADAIEVSVHDPLATQLDAATLDVYDGGVYDPVTHALDWSFPDLHLPPGATDAVRFSVTPVPGLPPGTEIRNQAEIVFDVNPPILTPETVSVIGSEEQLELQDLARRVAAATLGVESTLIGHLADPEACFQPLDAAMASAWQAFWDVNGGRLPWLSLNGCQAALGEFLDLLPEPCGAGLPPELVAEWVATTEELGVAIVDSYPDAPVAVAGEDGTVEATGSLTPVTLDGSSSYDPNPAEGLVSYTWYDDDGAVVAEGAEPVVDLALGSHRFTLVVSDGTFDSPVIDDGSADDAVVVVTVVDTTPPEITVRADPDLLWPPNHKLVWIEVTVTVADLVDPAPQVWLESVESSEPDDGLGSGDRPGDVQEAEIGTDDRSLRLRAERSGRGDGRTYVLTYTAVDASGNSATAMATVLVPHDRGKAFE